MSRNLEKFEFYWPQRRYIATAFASPDGLLSYFLVMHVNSPISIAPYPAQNYYCYKSFFFFFSHSLCVKDFRNDMLSILHCLGQQVTTIICGGKLRSA